MKLLFISLFVNLLALSAFAQDKVPSLDNSPLDMAYVPSDYPVLKIRKTATESPLLRILYSRPQKKERKIFGELVEYGKIWRLGANEATELECFRELKMAGQKLKKGRYTVYAIPYEEKWTIIINRDTDTWGAFVYDSKKDVLRFDVPVEKTNEPVEVFTISTGKSGSGNRLSILWDDVKVEWPVNQ